MNRDLERFGASDDQREEFLKAFEPYRDRVRVMRNRVLVGTYVQRTKTRGGILIPAKTIEENAIYQGKVGIILKLGPIAFEFPENFQPGPGNNDLQVPAALSMPQVGDWVFYRNTDTWESTVGCGIPVKFLYDDSIVGVIDDPEQIW